MGWTPDPTPSCQQPDAVLWLLHQHPVNQGFLIFYEESFPEVMASRGMCVFVCVHNCLYVFILIISPLKRQRVKREKSDFWCQDVQRSPNKISVRNNMPCFYFTLFFAILSDFHLSRSCYFIFLLIVSVLDWNNLLIGDSCCRGSKPHLSVRTLN